MMLSFTLTKSFHHHVVQHICTCTGSQICWHIPSFKTNIKQDPSLNNWQYHKPAGRDTLWVQLWEFKLEDYEEQDSKFLLKLVREVNHSMKMKDSEFKPRRLPKSLEVTPLFPSFKDENFGWELWQESERTADGGSHIQMVKATRSDDWGGTKAYEYVLEILWPRLLR